MGNDLRLNFISSLILTALSIVILVGSFNIYARSSEPLHSSPGLMPGMLGIALLLCSVLLFRQSIVDDGLRKRSAEAKAWLVALVKHPDTRSTVVGLALMAIYTFVLIHVFQFWVASLIFAIAMLAFLRSTKWYWILVISGATVGGIVLLFDVVFNVPLP